ncbi:MAG: CapA family protein, partial [Lachnospiraceae bacterium]|nr:CapA family protein [Lachnospiraceae bacterium]
NGRTFGFLGASRVWPDGAWSADYDRPGMFGTYDPTQLLEEIRKAKEVCDFVTVFVHWGIERNTTPEEYQRAMAKQYEEAGADLVIGSHPHVLQGFEFINDMPVFYSLGNFIFNTRTYDTAVVRAVVRGDGTTEFSLIPARSDGARVSLLTGDAGSQLFSYLNTISYGALADENGVLRKE